jgi:hypothetical protein
LKTLNLATKLHKDTQRPFNKNLSHFHVMVNITDKALFRFRLYPGPYALGPRPTQKPLPVCTGVKHPNRNKKLTYKEKKHAN